jgi:hypothetical protein
VSSASTAPAQALMTMIVAAPDERERDAEEAEPGGAAGTTE